jgi:2-polyprenyl-6-methoxyphenol hydroxylase-like FAD-dependent oxidoreductase
MGGPDRIRGVRIRFGGEHARDESMPADLVIDATGRDSPTPRWLERLGLRAPPQEHIPAEMTYTTRTYPRTPDQLEGQLLAVCDPRANRRCGIALALEEGRWMVTLGHATSQPPPLEPAAFAEYARALATTELYDIVRAADPLSQATSTTFDSSLRRRYDRLRLPEGLVVVGDALCSTNPIYAQGMSLGAMQAQWLDQCLHDGLPQLGQRFFSSVGPLLDAAWSLVHFGDVSVGAMPAGLPALAADLLRGYFERLQRAAVLDAAAARAFLRVLQLEAPPRSLLSASLAARALLGGETQAAYTPHGRPVPG